VAMEPGIKRLIERIARANEERFRDGYGNVDKEALSSFVLDEFERIHEDAFPTLEEEGARFFVWEAIRGMFRATRSGLSAESGDDGQPMLPHMEEVVGVKLTIPATGGRYDAKDAIDCALWELEAVAVDYEQRADALLQHRRFVMALIAHMREQGFAETDTVRKLYKSA
jgi:hypothetical protein